MQGPRLWEVGGAGCRVKGEAFGGSRGYRELEDVAVRGEEIVSGCLYFLSELEARSSEEGFEEVCR